MRKMHYSPEAMGGRVYCGTGNRLRRGPGGACLSTSDRAEFDRARAADEACKRCCKRLDEAAARKAARAAEVSHA